LGCLLFYPPEAFSQYADTACIGEIASGYRVISTPGSNYQWFVKGGSIVSGQGTNDIKINWGNIPGVYDLKVLETSAGTCTGDTISAQILLIQNPVVTISSDDSVCIGDPVILNAAGASKYFWNEIEGSQTLIIFPKQDTIINLRGMIASCTSTSISKKIIAVPKPVASFVFNPTEWIISDVVNFAFNGSNATRLLWYFDNDLIDDGYKTSLSKTLKDSGELTVTLWAIGAYGCNDSMQYTGRIFSGWTVFAPTAFTPNNDGINDVFGVEYFGYKKGGVTIFNRYGVPVYKSNDLNFGWDGYFEGNAQPSDIYTFELIVYDRLDRQRLISGKFNLIR
jgi:gliding motility-associated-like protein